MRKNYIGFTIIELVVVIAIIAALASIVLINVASYTQKSKDARLRADFHQIAIAEASYVANSGHFAQDVYPGVAPSFVPTEYPGWDASYYCSDCVFDWENWGPPAEGGTNQYPSGTCLGINLRHNNGWGILHGYSIQEDGCPGVTHW